MNAPARPLVLVLFLCLAIVLQTESEGQSTSSQVLAVPGISPSSLPSPGLIYGTTRYFNQLSFTTGFTLADINRDGVLDLIAPQYGASNIAISLGDASRPGTFLPPTFLSVRTVSTEHITVADLNADGLPDIIYADTSQALAGIFFQDPSHPGSFLPSVALGAPIIKPLVADMNHDGLPDILLFEGHEGNGPAILFNDPQHPGSFNRTAPTSFAAYGSSTAIVADLNGDGLPDLVISDDPMSQTISVMLNDAAHPGNLLPEQHYSAGGGTYFDLAAGDLNGDGLPDVVVGAIGGGFSVLLGNPGHPGTLLPPHIYQVVTTPAGTETVGITLGDINGDGKLDVVVGNFGSAFGLLLGYGDGTFSPSLSYPTGPIPKTFYENTVQVADIDGDGLQDVVVGQFFQNSVQLFLHRPSSLPFAISATDQALNATSVRPGDAVTLTIKVSAFQGIPSGTVTLYGVTNDPRGTPIYNPITVLPLDSTGTAIYTDRFQSGTHTFRSFYPGDQIYAPSTSLFDTATITANPVVALSLTAAPNPAALGQNVVIAASVVPTSPAATGTITFLDNGAMLGSVPLSAAGAAVLNTTSLTLGAHTLTASFPGDANYAAQQASTVEVIGNPIAQFSVVSSLNPAAVGQPVTFTARVAASNPAPTGNVSFTDNAAPLVTVPLAADGSAAYTTSALAQGFHLIRATYSGDASYGTLTDTLTEAITSASATPPTPTPTPTPPVPVPGDFTLTAGPPLTLQGQQNGAATLTVTPINGLSDTIALSCGSLPLYVTCQIAPAAVSLNGTAPQQATIQIATGQSPAFTASIQRRTLLFAAALPFLLLPWPRALTRTRLAAFLLLAPLLGGLLGSLAGCGFSKFPISTPPGTYTIILSGHGAGSRLDRSTTLTLIVK